MIALPWSRECQEVDATPCLTCPTFLDCIMEDYDATAESETQAKDSPGQQRAAFVHQPKAEGQITSVVNRLFLGRLLALFEAYAKGSKVR